MQKGKVVGRKQGINEEAKGVANTNPLLYTRTYDAEFPDGEVNKYSTGVVVENMFVQCDMEGNHFVLMSDFFDHKKDGHALEIADGFVQCGSNRHRQVTTKV